MYRRTTTEQLKLEIPFGVVLDANNRWVKLSAIMPWEKIDEEYAKNFTGDNGQVAKPSQLAFGALYIQGRLSITDEETVAQIQENPSMQYFCGFETYTPNKPFDSSLMVHFRKRITAEMVAEISDEAFKAHAQKAILSEVATVQNDDSDSVGKENDDTDSSEESEPKPQGTLLLDATCCPVDIHYPTDVRLLNEAREITERVIDLLYAQAKEANTTKPRTYRHNARREFLSFAMKRKHSHQEIRSAIRGQLQYVRRNLSAIDVLSDEVKSFDCLPKDLHRKLIVVSEVYRQQKLMYDEKTHSVEGRIVSISRPHLRPIVRGKSGSPVEFGPKVATARIGGFVFVIHMDYENFSEAKYLEATAEKYKELFGFYPEVIIGDKAYGTNENRKYCGSKGIRLSAAKKGRKSAEVKEAERKQLYADSCKRNAVESDYGVTKRKYGLDLVMTKLCETTLTVISVAFFIKNMERVMRLFVLQFCRLPGICWQCQRLL